MTGFNIFDAYGARLRFFALAILSLLITAGIANADCTLQLHAYDFNGYALREATMRITSGDIVLLDDWTMTDGYYDMVDFRFEGDQLDMKIKVPKGEQDVFGTILISNDRSKPVFYKIISRTTDQQFQYNYNYDMSCSQTNETYISKYGYARPDLEPQCYDGYEDIYNGGCNSETQMFTEIQCGETVMGSVGKFRKGELEILDEDWYLFTLPYETEIQIGGFCESPLKIEIMDYEDCENIEVIDTLDNNLCYMQSKKILLSTGQHLIRVIPELPWGFSCDSGLEYALSIFWPGASSEPACSTEEESVCTEDFNDAVNDLCESAEDFVSNLVPSCINSGTTGYYIKDGNITADIDYFSFHIWEDQDISLMMESASPLTVGLFYGDCADHILLDSMTIPPLINNTFQFDLLQPGDYLLRIEPETDAGTSCGSKYKLLLDAGIHSNNCNNAGQIDTDGFYDTERKIKVEGDTTFANNFYTAAEYGCGDDLNTPETVHRLIVDERMTISVNLEAMEWEPRLVVTKEWPPVDCLYGEYDPATPMTVSIPGLTLKPNTSYFFFVEGTPGQYGHYEMEIRWIDPAAELLTVDLELNKDRFNAGDPVILTGYCENHTFRYINYSIALILEIEGEYWFYNNYGHWKNSMDDLPQEYISVEETEEWQFIDTIWPESSFFNISAEFTFFLFHEDDVAPYLESNIVTEEFIF